LERNALGSPKHPASYGEIELVEFDKLLADAVRSALRGASCVAVGTCVAVGARIAGGHSVTLAETNASPTPSAVG
jgi:hypothetical protein